MEGHIFESLFADAALYPFDLHISASVGCEERVREIIENPETSSVIDEQNAFGWTPLMYAACCGNLKVLALLLEDGANPYLKNALGHTALILAARCGSTDAVAMLLTFQSDINETDHKGLTALSHASTYGHKSIVQVLIEKGAAVDLAEKTDRLTSLMLAAFAGHGTIVNILLQGGSNPLAQSDSGDTAKTFAHKNGHFNVESMLDAFIALSTNRQITQSPFNNSLKTLLQELQLSKYYDIFENQDIDLNTFYLLTEDDIMTIGIKLLGPRKKMCAAIARWHQNQLTKVNHIDTPFENKLLLDQQKLTKQIEDLKSMVFEETKARNAAECNLRSGIETLRNFAETVQKNVSCILFLQEKLKQSQSFLRQLLSEIPNSGKKSDVVFSVMNDMDKLLKEINRQTVLVSQQNQF